MRAALNHHDDIAVRLAQMGASLTRKDVNGKTALDLASDELAARMRKAVSLSEYAIESMSIHVFHYTYTVYGVPVYQYRYYCIYRYYSIYQYRCAYYSTAGSIQVAA